MWWGTLILLGMFKVVRPAWASLGLVTIGALAGALATVWTIVVPILVLSLIALAAGRPAVAAETI